MCVECHVRIEKLPHREMHKLVMNLIKRRDKQPVEIPESAWEFYENEVNENESNRFNGANIRTVESD
jgi:hypothetical protein